MSGYYDYYDYPGLDAAAGMGGLAGVLAGVLVIYLLFFGLSIAMYILQSLGMYSIAKRRGIKHPWMAWLPVTNLWILGSIADQYQYVAKGLVRNRRKALLGLAIAAAVLYIVMMVICVGMVVNTFLNIPQIEYMPDSEILGLVLTPLLSMLGIALVLEIVAIISIVLQFICLHKLFASCDPEHKTLFTVLSILFAVTIPFFIFACRKKDLGMPPRRDTAPTPQPVLPPIEEPWNNE